MKTTASSALALTQFLDTMRGHMKFCEYSHETIKAYIGQVQGFIRFNCPVNLENITERDIQGYLTYLLESSLSRSTIDQAAKAMEILYYELFGKQLDLSEFKRPKTNRPDPVVLSPDEVNQIAYSTKTLRNWLMVELAYSAGLRVSELVKVKVEHLDLERLMLHVPGLGEKKRITFFSEHLKNSLIKQIESKKTFQYLFPSERGGMLTTRAVAKFFKKALIASGLKKLATPHSLRQSFTSSMLNQGTDPIALQSILGRRTLNNNPSPGSKKAA